MVDAHKPEHGQRVHSLEAHQHQHEQWSGEELLAPELDNVTGESRAIGAMIAGAPLDARATVYITFRKADACTAAAYELSKRQAMRRVRWSAPARERPSRTRSRPRIEPTASRAARSKLQVAAPRVSVRPLRLVVISRLWSRRRGRGWRDYAWGRISGRWIWRWALLIWDLRATPVLSHTASRDPGEYGCSLPTQIGGRHIESQTRLDPAPLRNGAPQTPSDPSGAGLWLLRHKPAASAYVKRPS